MKITVIGRGNVGGGLARRWRAAGHEVQELGRDGGEASDADVLLVAVPGPEIANALGKVAGIGGKLTIDALIYRATKGVDSAVLSMAGLAFGLLPLRLYPLLAVLFGGVWNRVSLGLPEPKGTEPPAG